MTINVVTYTNKWHFIAREFGKFILHVDCI